MGEIKDFKECVVTCGSIELPYSQSRYTWSDKQGGNRIRPNIDWALVNSKWLGNMPHYSVHLLPEGVSDHSPIHVVLKSNMTQKRKAFKYCN